MLKLPFAISDPTLPAAPAGAERLVDQLVVPYLVDSRDVVFTRLTFHALTRVLPVALALFLLPTWIVALAAIPYLAWIFVVYAGPVMLMLHAVTHRPVFKKRHRHLDRVITHGLPMFWGLTPAAYHPHHVLMHHTENNGLDDLSSTAAYRRDSFAHFLHYWARFAFFGYWHMLSWLARRGKADVAIRMVAGEFVAFALMALAVWLNPVAGLVVFVAPFLLLRCLMMMGNWSEHAFMDASAPTNSWRNSTCLLNTPYNHRSFNAGYHLLHHLKPGMHWAEAPAAFEKDLQRYVDNDAVLFDGVRNNQQIWWKLMTGDYGYLADRLVDLAGRRPTREEKIAFLQERVRGTSGVRKGMIERVEARA